MSTYSFLDDYSEGCHPEILDAMVETNLTQQTSYGNDDYTAEARRLIAGECEKPDAAVFLVASGTLANLLIAAATLRPHEAIISAASGHIALRETGAIEATGHKIISVPSADGRLTPIAIDDAMAANAQAPHMAKPRLVYISNATEFGTVYSHDELRALRSTCDKHGLLLMIDGARLGVALASDRAGGLTLADVASLADIFWIGGTKTGTLFGEAIVIPNGELAVEFEFHLKQRGALLAKGRALGLQFRALFDGDLFGRASRTANDSAKKLSTGIRAAGFELAAETESNQVFAVLPNSAIATLKQSFAFYVWEPRPNDASVVRLVTSWATEPAAVDRLIATLADLA